MAKVQEITVSAGRTFNHPYESFSNLRSQVTVRATPDENESTEEASKHLQLMCDSLVDEHKRAKLEDLRKKYYPDEEQIPL